MGLELPDPPASLPGAPRAFYDEFRKMLGLVDPKAVDRERSKVTFDDEGVELHIAHAEHDDVAIWAGVSDDDAIVATGGVHEHFAPDVRADEERPWTMEIVDFVAEILRGQIEIDTTFRGRSPIAVSHFRVEDSGERVPFGRTGFLSASRLFFWAPKRVETERVSFL